MTSGGTRVRKLTARSAVLSALLGAHPAEASAAGILAMATKLGFQHSAVRVALTRLVAAGDLDRSEGMYRLSPRLIRRQRRQDFALQHEASTWDGSWRLAIVTTGAEDSTDRAALRTALRAAKFGEVREGVWGRPNNIPTTVRADASERLSLFTAVPDGDPAELVEHAFAPQEWAGVAEELIRMLRDAPTLVERFEIAAAIVRHILDDPLLPAEALPTDWPGHDIRETYEAFRSELTALAGGILTATK
ncbi:PaaX family transcriptional regulator C-terminal domain-containing protein [Rhodococcus sp. G-MC3]|uniref:PaaX family transcriptional regulator C-terminal domain-containing protein n=1 Tax=Rhodococcus sp. G-MC3 TaxID=3046209 RepID=UPI0024BBBFC5|nr:PaaX family transcriptional regulator C-terminal domain-containing protein [Rhodococcus sp. G-MC3]MDJ0396594.1 PaaX family transcriptional regulator C-terminal domain-containing protein [Rhodococcus sp. G-MC3]